MRSLLFPWLSGALVALSGALVLALPLGFPIKLVVACLTIFLTDSLGGRWFGYASVLVLFAGLSNDVNGLWATMMPLVAGSALAAMVVRHSERTWFGVLLAMAVFMLPAVVMQLIRPRFDPALQMPLGSRYIVLHMLASSFAILVSSLLTWQQLSPPAATRLKPMSNRKTG